MVPPPTLVNDNIKAFCCKFSPTTKIRELPSIWTIWRARLVLLVIIQKLAAYRLAKANKWEKLFTNATSQRQVTFQNLVISVEEDDVYKPLLVSICIFPEDEISETVCQSIIYTLKEKYLMLDRWKEIHEAEFGPDAAHDIIDSS